MGSGIIPIIITGRQSDIVKIRCTELGITHIIQGSSNKTLDLKKVLSKEGIALKETAYIGDDMNDYECMLMTGLKGCPNDADKRIKEVADYVAECKGGKGAVREFIEWIWKMQEV